MSKKYYVAYGSNLNMEQMARRCPTASVVGKGYMNGWRLEFWGVATVVKDKNSRVPVGLWEIDKESEKALDIYEGWPRLYGKKWVNVEMDDGTVVRAMVYVMNYGKGSVPSRFYYDTIETGYEEFCLDASYLEAALGRAVKDKWDWDWHRGEAI